MDGSRKKEKAFFKYFIPESSSQRLKIPKAYVRYKNGKLPKKVTLRDRDGKMWPIGLGQRDGEIYFQEGWEKFIEENNVESSDFFIFDYDGNGVFDFKLLGLTACEKSGARLLKSAVKEEEEEEINVVQKRQEPKRMNVVNYTNTGSSSSSSSDESENDEDEDYTVEEEEEDEETEEEEEEEDNNAFILKRRSPNSKAKCKRGTAMKRKHLPDQYEEMDEETEEKEVEEEPEEDEEEDENAVTLKKKALHSKAKRRRVNAIKKKDQYEETEEEEDGNEKKKTTRSKGRPKRTKEDLPDLYGADIFKSGRAIQPRNPYFVAKICARRRDQLYVPVDVVRDYKLELPPTITIRDSFDREFEATVKNWKDGRIWLIGGWRSLCRWNLVEKDDRCICEFVKGKRGLQLQVQVIHEAAVSNPSKEK